MHRYFRTGTYDDSLVNISAMPAEKKRAVWLHLQQHHPNTAELMQDPQLQALMQAFDCSALLPPEMLPEEMLRQEEVCRLCPGMDGIPARQEAACR